MKNEWSTKENDLQVARLIIDEFANARNSDSLGLFELVVGAQDKKMDLRLSAWVDALSTYFNTTYGNEYGDFVTKMVISKCITNGQVLH